MVSTMWSFKNKSPLTLTVTLPMPVPFSWFLATQFTGFYFSHLRQQSYHTCKSLKALQGVDMASKTGQNWAEKFKYQVWKQPPINRCYLDPARDKVVWGGEYELLGTWCLWRRQDHLPSSSSIWAGQDELLFGRSGGVHCGDYLDLLSCLLVSYNLQDTTWRPLCIAYL